MEPSKTILQGRGTLLHCKNPLVFLKMMPSHVNFTLLISVGAPRSSTRTRFEPDLQVRSICVPRTGRIAVWAFEAVIAKARIRRIPRIGKSWFATMSLHCHNTVAKKRSIAQDIFSAVRTAMFQEDMDLLASDSNGASWRRKVGADQQFDSTLEDAFKKRQTPRFGALAAFLTNGPTSAGS